VRTEAHDTGEQSLANEYRSRALDSIKRALALLPRREREAFWRDTILTDAALTSLRDDPAFHRLEKELSSTL
jgi:hypothetical protein